MRFVLSLLILLPFAIVAQDSSSIDADTANREGTITIEKEAILGIFSCNYSKNGSESRKVYWHLKDDGSIYSLRTNKSCNDPLLRESLVFYRYIQHIGQYMYHAGKLRIIVTRNNNFLSTGIHYLGLTGSGFLLDQENEFYLCQ